MNNQEENIVTCTEIAENAAESQSTEKVEGDIVAEEMNVATHQQNRRKSFLILAVMCVVIAVAVAAFFLIRGGKPADSNYEALAISAYTTADGAAYIPLHDGTYIVINEDVETALLTKDRQNLVVLLKDGMLYVTDPKQTNRTVIADNISDIWVRDDGFVYKDENGILYKSLFAELESIEVGKASIFTVAQNTVSLLYTTDNKEIYTMAANSDEGVKVGSYDATVTLKAISDDAQISVWVEKDGEETSIYLNDGENRSTLSKSELEYEYTYVEFTEDQKMAVVMNALFDDCLWIKTDGGEPLEVKLAGEPNSIIIYSENGWLHDEKSTDVDSFFISTQGETYSNIYNITIDGNRERLLSQIKEFDIVNGIIVYLDDEDDLYWGKIDGNEVLDSKKIASEVSVVEVTNNGNYIYYIKDYDDDEEVGTLFCYKMGTDEAVKVASEVSCYGGVASGWTNNVYSADGETVFYYKDMEEIEDTYSAYGTLMKWTYGEEIATKVASEVLKYSPTSGISSGDVIESGFSFLKYTHVDSKGNVLADLMYYNGEDAEKGASDVID